MRAVELLGRVAKVRIGGIPLPLFDQLVADQQMAAHLRDPEREIEVGRELRLPRPRTTLVFAAFPLTALFRSRSFLGAAALAAMGAMLCQDRVGSSLHGAIGARSDQRAGVEKRSRTG